MGTPGWTLNTPESIAATAQQTDDEIAPLATREMSSTSQHDEMIAALDSVVSWLRNSAGHEQASGLLGPARDAVAKFFERNKAESIYDYVTDVTAMVRHLCDIYVMADSQMAEEIRVKEMNTIADGLSVGMDTGTVPNYVLREKREITRPA